MKKLLALLLAMMMLVLCCACAEIDKQPGNQTEQPQTQGNPGGDFTVKQPENQTEQPQTQGYPGVDFTVYDREGNQVSLSDMVGKPVVVNFWATWCGPCKSELPAFQQAYENYGDDVVFMMVDMVQGRTETKEGAIEYVDGQGYKFPLYFDQDQTAVIAYEIGAVPASYFIDAQGNLVDSHVGAMSYDQLEGFIKQLL